MLKNCLVTPILPTRIFELIDCEYAHHKDKDEPWSYSSSETMNEEASLLTVESHDERCKLKRTLQALNISITDSQGKSPLAKDDHQNCLIRKFFAAKLIYSLWLLRFHDAKGARVSLQDAESFYNKQRNAIPKGVALESIGLVSALLRELEDKLARIERCL